MPTRSRTILEGARQGFVGGVNTHDTLLAFLALGGLMAFFGAFATRGLSRYGN